MTTIRSTLEQTDWPLLAQQKLALIEVIEICPTTEQTELLQGLLHWIDALQDAAQAEGFNVVFLTTDD